VTRRESLIVGLLRARDYARPSTLTRLSATLSRRWRFLVAVVVRRLRIAYNAFDQIGRFAL
jgi:hypothetical protein